MTTTRRMNKSAHTRRLRDLMALYPGSTKDLAAALGVTRQTVWTLRRASGIRRPYELLRSLGEVLGAAGMADGSPPPTLAELVRAWDAAQRSPR
jgi:hypothetical protein